MNEEERIVTQTPPEEPEQTVAPEPAETVEAPVEAVEIPVASEQTTETPKKKKPIVLIAIIVVLVLALAIGAFLLFGNSGKAAIEADPTNIAMRIVADGTAYLPTRDGSFLHINNDVAEGYLTSDDAHIVLLLEDGMLYVGNNSLSEKALVTEKAADIFGVDSTGFFYEDENEIFTRYLYADGSAVELGQVVDYTIAPESRTIFYVLSSGEVCILPADAAEPVQVDKLLFSDEANLIRVSSDGQLAIWEKYDQVYLYNGEQTTLGECGYPYCSFSKDEAMAVVVGDDSMWVLTRDAEPTEVKMGAEVLEISPYSRNGRIGYENAADINEMYIAVEGDEEANLYYFTAAGDRERVISDLYNYTIENGRVFYLTTDEILYCAELDGYELVNETRIASDVQDMSVSCCGNYVYYCKANEEYDGELVAIYAYKVGDEEPQKLTSEALWYYDICTDGSVLFMDDIAPIEDSYLYNGTLRHWTYGDDEAVKISSEVVEYSVTSYDSAGIDPDHFFYQKYVSAEDDCYFTNLMLYNGTESTKVISDIQND